MADAKRCKVVILHFNPLYFPSVQLISQQGYRVRVWVRPRSHSRETHDDGHVSIYGDGKNAVNQSHSKLRSVKQRKNSIYPVVVDLVTVTSLQFALI